jgi:amicyanin
MRSLFLSTGSRRAATVAAVAVIIVAISVLVAACGNGGSSDTTATTATTAPSSGSSTTASAGGGSEVKVIMTNRSYDPETVTIKVGDTVTWVNEDAPQHDVVADNGEFKSDLFDKGQTFSFTFTKAGTYPYHCSIHPGMTGTVIVE